MRTRDQITKDLLGFQTLERLKSESAQRRGGRSTGLRGLSAYQVERDGQTGRTQIKTADGATFEAIDIGLGVKRSGDRIPSAVSDRGTTWIDYA